VLTAGRQRLAPGLCLRSYAYYCAEAYGISKHITDRALEVSNALSSFEAHKIMDPKMTEEDKEELVEAENILRRMLEMKWIEDQDEDEDEAREEHHMDGRSAMAKLAYVLGKDTEGV
jgi:DNA mismatch repair ATPase MutS